MDGVGIPIIERPRPLPGHDTPNPTQHPYTLKCEEPDNGVPSKTATHQTPQSAQSLKRTRHARRRALKYRISHTDTLLP